MRKVNIALIGGSGFIGSSVFNIIDKQKYNVVIFDKQKPMFECKYFYCDLGADLNKNDFLDIDFIINLAAEHRDDVHPKSMYDLINVEGSRKICRLADDLKIKNILFTSSVAIYGSSEKVLNEYSEPNYFNDYGRTKYLAEQVYLKWKNSDTEKNLTIVRPTVVFGPKNRGNVYNLLNQIFKKRFILIGNGSNRKSMAYVENVASFIIFSVENNKSLRISNYVDKPDFTMKELVQLCNKVMFHKEKSNVYIPKWIGLIIGYLFDLIAYVTRKKLPISSIRVKKFFSNTQFSSNIDMNDFQPKKQLKSALEDTIINEFLTK